MPAKTAILPELEDCHSTRGIRGLAEAALLAEGTALAEAAGLTDGAGLREAAGLAEARALWEAAGLREAAGLVLADAPDKGEDATLKKKKAFECLHLDVSEAGCPLFLLDRSIL